LVEFGPDQKFIRGFPYRALRGHSILIDRQDNMWLTDQNGGTVTKLNRDGAVLMVIGTPGKQGDWDEQAGSRLLWQPLSVALAANGDIFIGMGHGGESAGAAAGLSKYGNTARILHLTRDGKFVDQWISDAGKPGAFSMAHAILLDPSENIYIADREMDRIVIYDKTGKYLRSIDSGHLVCSMMVGKDGGLWISTGRDGQLEKTDWNGRVLGAAGLGPGAGLGQFGEACDAAMDARGDIYVSDGVDGRVQKLVAPARP
jgi:sugar lactone lactonase YvrE